ncbi:MAG: hypothetical protein EZS28_001196 [Streblomastix strix]|uniref:Uncharacterized protein n=1 Tax=Streblomastix strix TaxID=222440 RepID=A0A5J4X7Y6_9EUKA|nr:MAG: hypothetical protein EZS28_001196 [Streblomastix strix]
MRHFKDDTQMNALFCKPFNFFADLFATYDATSFIDRDSATSGELKDFTIQTMDNPISSIPSEQPDQQTSSFLKQGDYVSIHLSSSEVFDDIIEINDDCIDGSKGNDKSGLKGMKDQQQIGKVKRNRSQILLSSSHSSSIDGQNIPENDNIFGNFDQYSTMDMQFNSDFDFNASFDQRSDFWNRLGTSDILNGLGIHPNLVNNNFSTEEFANLLESSLEIFGTNL